MAKCSSIAILPCIEGYSPVALKKIALPFAAAAGARFRWFGARRIRNWRAIGAGADAAVGELDLDRHARGDGCGGAQWLACGIANKRKAPRQHAAIGKRREQLRAAFASRAAHGDEVANGQLGTLGEHCDELALTRDTRSISLDVRGKAGAQPQRNAGVALAPALDIGAQQLRSEPAADARKTNTVDLRVGAQRPSKPRGGMIESLSRQRQHVFAIRQRA